MYASCAIGCGTDWIEEWNDGIIAPIMKKREGERVEDYKG